VIIAVAVPVLLYLAFQTGLNAGLPQGILPFG
jgi:putative tricarboxylic transport membrane protein